MDDLKVVGNVKHPEIREIGYLKKFRGRDDSGRFLIEGHREILRALEGGIVLEKVFVSVPIKPRDDYRELISLLALRGVPLVYCAEEVLENLTYRDGADGFLGVGKAIPCTPERFFNLSSKKAAPLYLVIESVEKPGNTGAILRCADAVGVTGVLFCGTVVDIYNPNIIRSSLGTIFSIPILETTSKEAFSLLSNRGISIVTTSPRAERSYLEPDYTRPTALVFGSEKSGVTDFWIKKSDETVFIPMKGYADSLNVAMSVTVTLYEVLKQRDR